MEQATGRIDSYAALRVPEFRYWLGAAGFASLGGRGLVIALGFQVYTVSQNPLALGLLGLVEAIPSISLSLFGGHVADRRDRRNIVLITRAVSVLCALTLAFLSQNIEIFGLSALYAVVFAAGIARGFGDPANSAFEAQVVPRELYVNASTWAGTMWQLTAIAGPALAGLVYAAYGVTTTYLMLAGFYALAWICMSRIKSKPMPPVQVGESIWKSISVGVRYVVKSQVLLGSMALDLFAVLFGGAIALLPIFATDILQVGPSGLGFLASAPAVGALVAMLWSTRRPPVKNSGKIFLCVVAGFGVSMIVFALSKNFFLSLAALAFSGLFDGVSIVIRETLLRLYSPEALRGRIASVNWIFIGSSNEVGAFESGVAASLLGTVPAVALGGVVTLLVVAVTGFLAPELRNMELDPSYVPPLPEMTEHELETMQTL